MEIIKLIIHTNMKKHNYLSFEKLIEAEFSNADLNGIIKTLGQYKLYDFIVNSISQLNEHLKRLDEKKENTDVLLVAPVTAIMIIKFRSCLDSLSDDHNEEEQLSYILGCVIKRTIKTIIDLVPTQIKYKQLLSILCALQDVYVLYKYTPDALFNFIKTDDLALELYAQHQSEDHAAIIPDQIHLPGLYCLHLEPKNLPVLIKIFKDEGICDEEEKLLQLFNAPATNLSIQFSEQNVTHVLQFLAVLKDTGFIGHQNCKGFYQVFECHVKNFREIFLNGQTPQRRIDKARKAKNWYSKKEAFDAQFRQFVIHRDSA